MIRLLFLIFISTSVFADSSWISMSFREDNVYQYWVGISNEHPSEKLALNEAYQEALNEAAKYNFGFKHKVLENTYSNKTEHQIHQEIQWNSEKILFKEVKPLRQYIKEKNGKFTAYREISYPKKEISIERSRLLSLSVKEKKEQNIDTKNYTYGNLKLTTNIKNTKVYLSKADSTETKEILIPAEITLPTGLYYLVARRPGFNDVQKEVIISGGANFTHLELEKSLGSIKLTVYPEDAQIKVNGVKRNASLNNLTDGTYKIEVSHPDYLSLSQEIELINGDTIFKEILLKPKKSSINILSTPSDAIVFINGEKVGTTPLIGYNFSTQNEKFSVSLVKKGYDLIEKEFKYIPNKTIKTIKFDLIQR